MANFCLQKTNQVFYATQFSDTCAQKTAKMLFMSAILLSLLIVLTSGRRNSPEYVKKSFHDMNKEELDEALGEIFFKMDSNKGNGVSIEELEFWIMDVHNKTIEYSTKSRFDYLDENSDRKISWHEFRNLTYAIPSDDHKPEAFSSDQNEELQKTLKSDRKRFQVSKRKIR